MDRMTITLTDHSKREEFLALVTALPYVEAVQLDETDEMTDDAVNGQQGEIILETNGATDESHSPVYQDPQTQLMDREIAAFDAMKAALLETYADAYVAVCQGRVVDHDMDKALLLERLAQTHPSEVVLVRQVRQDPRPPFRLRSPRLTRR